MRNYKLKSEMGSNQTMAQLSQIHAPQGNINIFNNFLEEIA